MSRIAMHFCEQHHTTYAGTGCPLCARATYVRIDKFDYAALQEQRLMIEEAIRKAHGQLVERCKPYTPEILGVIAVLSDALLRIDEEQL
jgi:hypothetical protein